MKLAIFAYSQKGCRTALTIAGCFPEAGCSLYTPQRLAQGDFIPLSGSAPEVYEDCFEQCDALVFVSACGIAVRKIAPYVKDKRTDPAVLCVDELGQYVIPILSGHIGGANAMAGRLAEKLSAIAVITTATDINCRFSVDTWAKENGCIISSMPLAKVVSAAILEREIPVSTHLPISGQYPPGTIPGDFGELGVYIGWHTTEPFDRTLRLVPKRLHLGLGCRKGTTEDVIAETVSAVLQENNIDEKAIVCAASVDLKAEEAGLLAYCEKRGLPIQFYSAAELMQLEGDYSVSPFVQKIAGVDCVCERAAMMGADRLIVKKYARNGVTVAIAAERYEVHFG